MILALDTSVRRTGYVRGLPGGPVQIGSIVVPEVERFHIGRLLDAWAREAWPLFQGVEKVFFEAPILPFKHTDLNALRRQFAIYAHVEFLAVHAGVDAVEIAPGRHKKLIYDHGGAKPLNATQYARAWGFPARNDDEADACGVFLAGLAAEYPAVFNRWVSIRAQSPPIARQEKPKSRQSKQPRDKRKAGQVAPSLFDNGD